MQRAVASDTFYGSKLESFDSVLITKSVHQNELSGTTYSYSCWFAKVLRFITISHFENCSFKCPDHNRNNCRECSHCLSNDFCFIQWYEIMNKGCSFVDEIDRTLNSIRLRWQENPGKEGQLLASKENGLVPVESIRGVVRVVSKTLTNAE